MFKSYKKLKVVDYDSYKRKDGREIELIILGDVDLFIRYTLRIPAGMPKPKIGDFVEVIIDLKEYQGRLYPVLLKLQ